MMPPHELQDYRKFGVIGREDIAAATVLVSIANRDYEEQLSLLAWVGFCLALRTVRDGHTCVDFDNIREWAGGIEIGAANVPDWPLQPDIWIDSLQAVKSLVGCSEDRRPFVIDGHRLYLARALSEEQDIASVLMHDSCRQVRVLLGGPGTGKTTKIAQDLVERFSNLSTKESWPRLGLAAPTGKAASRMTDVLRHRCLEVGAPASVVAAVTAEPARTVHKLLDYNPSRVQPFRYHAGNRLPYDMVIVDEASMLSSSLMYHLLTALADDAEVILVGDPDQLASVDAGTVLGDIAGFRSERYKKHPLHNKIAELTTVHRAKDAPGIKALAESIRAGDVSRTRAVLEAGHADVQWIELTNGPAVEGLLAEIVDHAKRLQSVAKNRDLDNTLAIQQELQVLCAHREGFSGVTQWNARVEAKLGITQAMPWYIGQPIMITRNCRSLALFNGDVGVIVASSSMNNHFEAIFGQPGQTVRVPVSRLEDVATVHALTIHKSQGSEYQHAVVVLPEHFSRIVTRELVYTAVTRAIKKVTLVCPRNVLEAAIKKPIRRATGLAERMTSLRYESRVTIEANPLAVHDK
ncbi:exodeoxyribonuclease V subunit alpha [Pirellulales bacterium]|nr:exodeoxyribonuclease V subunit alpha [Pirellulales bacterium]